MCYHEKEMMAIKVGCEERILTIEDRLICLLCLSNLRLASTAHAEHDSDEVPNYYPSVALRVKEKYIR